MSPTKTLRKIEYPTSDGKPMAETDLHRNLMVELIETLKDRYAEREDVYVTGNLLFFYEEGNRRKHVSPDVMVVKGVAKRMRDNYLMWEEGKGPDLVIELTSKTTQKEDTEKKRQLYSEVLEVQEYFLFDPTQDYLTPSFQGFRRVGGQFEAIEPVDGRLPSRVLDLHLEREGDRLCLWDPKSKNHLLAPHEKLAAQAEALHVKIAENRAQAATIQEKDAEIRQKVAALDEKDAEIARLRRLLGQQGD